MHKWLNNLLKFYGRQEEVVLHRSIESHKQQLFNLFESKKEKQSDEELEKTERMIYVYKKHLEAIKILLTGIHWTV